MCIQQDRWRVLGQGELNVPVRGEVCIAEVGEVRQDGGEHREPIWWGAGLVSS